MHNLGSENVYIVTYGKILTGYKSPGELEVGELTKKEYNLSGQSATVYVIIRTK